MKSGKGRRLVILHAIAEDGPLTERFENGDPVFDLKWSGDTPHSTSRLDNKKTAELLWMAGSHTGDYHDNMNSEMFMKWLQEKLIPVFEKLYEGKKMVLVADNAPYHHKRIIGCLGNLSKKQTVELMVHHGVEYIDLPYTYETRESLAATEGDNEEVQDRGDCVRIFFHPEEQLQRASSTKARVATLEELKVAFVTFCKEEKPELLECQVEAFLRERHHDILWTPPYCPELQPIELFWAAGKNHVRLKYNSNFKMKDVVKYLREGWYGNGNEFLDPHPFRKRPVDCRRLCDHCKEFAGTKYVSLCGGISGRMGELVVDPTYVDEKVKVPIDTLVVDMTSEETDNEILLETGML